MYRNDEPHYQLKRLRPRAPTLLSSDAIRQARRKAYLRIAALFLELCVTLSVCGLAIIMLDGGPGAGLFAFLHAELEQHVLGEQRTGTEDVPPLPTVRVLATGSPTRALGLQTPARPTATRTAARPIGNTGLSNTKPNASPTRAATLTSIPAGKAQIKAATPSITRASTTASTSTPTRTPSSGTCIFGCR